MLLSREESVFVCIGHERVLVERTTRERVIRQMYHDKHKDQQTAALYREAESAAQAAVDVALSLLPSKRKRARRG